MKDEHIGLINPMLCVITNGTNVAASSFMSSSPRTYVSSVGIHLLHQFPYLATFLKTPRRFSPPRPPEPRVEGGEYARLHPFSGPENEIKQGALSRHIKVCRVRRGRRKNFVHLRHQGRTRGNAQSQHCHSTMVLRYRRRRVRAFLNEKLVASLKYAEG